MQSARGAGGVRCFTLKSTPDPPRKGAEHIQTLSPDPAHPTLLELNPLADPEHFDQIGFQTCTPHRPTPKPETTTPKNLKRQTRNAVQQDRVRDLREGTIAARACPPSQARQPRVTTPPFTSVSPHSHLCLTSVSPYLAIPNLASPELFPSKLTDV